MHPLGRSLSVSGIVCGAGVPAEGLQRASPSTSSTSPQPPPSASAGDVKVHALGTCNSRTAYPCLWLVRMAVPQLR